MIRFHQDGDLLVVNINITSGEDGEEVLAFSRKCLNRSTARALAMMLNDMIRNAVAYTSLLHYEKGFAHGKGKKKKDDAGDNDCSLSPLLNPFATLEVKGTK